MSPARAQPTHSLHTHTAHRLLAAAPTPSPLPPTPAHPAWTAAHALLCPRVGGVRAYTLPLAPARRSLGGNDLDDVTEQALKAAARSGLELEL